MRGWKKLTFAGGESRCSMVANKQKCMTSVMSPDQRESKIHRNVVELGSFLGEDPNVASFLAFPFCIVFGFPFSYC